MVAAATTKKMTDDRKQSKMGEKTQDSKTQKDRERTPPHRLALRDD